MVGPRSDGYKEYNVSKCPIVTSQCCARRTDVGLLSSGDQRWSMDKFGEAILVVKDAEVCFLSAPGGGPRDQESRRPLEDRHTVDRRVDCPSRRAGAASRKLAERSMHTARATGRRKVKAAAPQARSWQWFLAPLYLSLIDSLVVTSTVKNDSND